jgi:hypothetical protein
MTAAPLDSPAPTASTPAQPRLLDWARELHRPELERGRGRVLLPDAMDHKAPAATTAWSC